MRTLLTIAALGVLAAGCTTADPNALAQNDRFEPTNRAIFAANNWLDRNAARPVAVFYHSAVPSIVRDSVHGVLANLNEPVNLGNAFLQGKLICVRDTLGRIVVNSTAGLGGAVDVAARHGVAECAKDFGETLAVWGVGDGPYLMLPLAGPSSPRDLAGNAVDNFGMDPLAHIKFHGSDTWLAVRGGVAILDVRSRNIATLDDIERTSIDYYAAVRSAYQQHRAAQINGGKPATDTPEF